MPDLHGWITQQIDEREQLANLIAPGGYAPDEWRIEPSRSGRWAQVVAYSRLNNEPPDAAVRGSDQPVALVQTGRNEHFLIALGDPAAVLRRCAADRKILAEHQPQGGDHPGHYACQGCGYDGGYCPEPIAEHVNDCPTLLALAEGYGLTEEQRAALDRPEAERPPRKPGYGGMPDALVEQLLRVSLASVPPGLRGPNWKAQP